MIKLAELYRRYGELAIQLELIESQMQEIKQQIIEQEQQQEQPQKPATY